MTIGALSLQIGVVSIIFAALVKFVFKKDTSWGLTFLQAFLGIFFIVSGFVKAIDPLGTAYKMEQYFAEFERAFEASWFSFISPMFPALVESSVSFSVFMIVLEIVLGAMLLIGFKRGLASWLYLAIIVFFLFLTGFTFLTGFVGEDASFFQVAKWGPWVETNMKVTDCGCFGDFLKLHPRTSFFKDVILLVPSIILVVNRNKLYQLFSANGRTIATAAITIAIIGFSVRNYQFNLPIADFRPFKEEVNIRETKLAEENALANVQITGYKLKNKNTGENLEFSYADYMKVYDQYKAEDGWEHDQIQSKPTLEPTKVSEFSVNGNVTGVMEYFTYVTAEGDTLADMDIYPEEGAEQGWTLLDSRKEESTENREITEDLLTDPNYSFMIVSHKMKKSNKEAFSAKVGTLHKAAEGKGLNFYAVVGLANPEDIEAFKKEINVTFPFHTADDILLKTIVRSNPGVVLLKDGKIIKKWHHRHIPDFATIESEYMKE